MTAPHEIVERALAASQTRGCIVLVRSVSVANLRWARTTLTTNGETESQSVTVIALADVDSGVGAGSVTVNAPDDTALLEHVLAQDEAAAVAAWHSKMDDALSFMLGQLEPARQAPVS